MRSQTPLQVHARRPASLTRATPTSQRRRVQLGRSFSSETIISRKFAVVDLFASDIGSAVVDVLVVVVVVFVVVLARVLAGVLEVVKWKWKWW